MFMYKHSLIIVTVPGKRDHLGNFFKIELLLQQERVGFELQNAIHILVMKAKWSGVIADSVHSFLSTAIG